MEHRHSLVLLLIIFISSCWGLIPTSTDIASARVTILKIIEDNARGVRHSTEYPFIAGFARLSFHDCVGPGHCDGCIDHKDPHNAGLRPYTDALDREYEANGYGTVMSRADFYALAATVALEKATETSTDKFSALKDGLFKVGRADCAKSPQEDQNGIFPEAEFNIDSTLKYFSAEFGFTSAEVVALMGIHTLGRAHEKASGFEGKWVKGRKHGRANSDILDNEYYLQLRGAWIQETVASSGKVQWQRPGTSPNSVNNQGPKQSAMFFNSDLSIAWDLDPVSPNGRVSCRVACEGRTCCPRSVTHRDFRSYVQSNNLWVSDFTRVFLKMINKNDNTLVNPKQVSPDRERLQKAMDTLNEIDATIQELENQLV